MSDEERFEKIRIALTFDSLNLCNAPRLKNFSWPYKQIHESDLAWLFEQVERVQKLEELCDDRIKDHARLHVANGELKKENNEFRKILSFVIELDCIDWNKNKLAEMARKALAGEFDD